MKIQEIMTTDVYCVEPSTPISQVAEILFSNRFHALPVVDKNKLVGIITQDDFFLKDDTVFLPTYMEFLNDDGKFGKLPKDIQKKIEKLLGTKARDIMTKECLSVTPDMETSQLLNLIKKTKYTSYPVTDENKKILGIITLSDILGTVRRTSNVLQTSLRLNHKKQIDRLAMQLDDLWNNKIMVVSRKSVRTWKGSLIIGISALLLAGLAVALTMKNNSACQSDDRLLLPTQCQKFTYTDWSACSPQGIQSRSISERLPKGCEGGNPVLTQSCRYEKFQTVE